MKIVNLKKKIKKRLIRNAIIIAVLIGLFVGAFVYNSSSTASLEQSRNRANSIQSQIASTKMQYAESEANLKEYLAMDKSKLPGTDGYELLRERLSVALPAIQDMKDVYSFKKLNLSLAEIRKMDNINSMNFVAYQNAITLDYAGGTDEYIYSFINDLKNTLPGYLNIESISLKRDNDINDETMANYIAPGEFSLVSGNIKLDWVVLKTIEAENAQQNQVQGGGVPQ